DWSQGGWEGQQAGTAATEPLGEQKPAARPAARAGESPDWLGRLREASAEDAGPPEGELPAWLAEEAPAAAPSPERETPPAAKGEVPDWLARVRAKHEEEGGEEEEAEAPAEQPMLQPDVFDLEKTGWHSGLTGLLPSASDLPEFKTPTEEPLPTEGQPALKWTEPESKPIQLKKRSGRLSKLVAKASTGELAKSQPVVEPEPTAGPPAPEPPVQPERTTGSLGAKAPSGAEFPGPFGARTGELFPSPPKATAPPSPAPPQAAWPPAPPSTSRLPPAAWPPAPPSTSPLPPAVWPPVQPPSTPPPTPPFGIGDLEDETGLSSLVPISEEPDSQPTRPPQVLPSTSPLEEAVPAEMAEPEWMKDLQQPAAPPAPGTQGPLQAPLPHVSALVPGTGEEGMDFDLDNVEVPDWLTEAGSMPSEAAIAPDARPDLAPATLPTWLEAMRPVDTFRSVVELLPEEEQAVESAGPLAGLRGVLMAEPVVALPRITGIGSTRLNVTERQVSQAEQLAKMVQEELREAPAAGRARRQLPLLRWAVAGLLVLAVALPVLLRLSVFPLPSVEPIELGQLVNLVAGLPTDRAALLVFDYEPANAGELEVVAGPLLEDLMAKGIPLATLSTRPTGPPLAERLMRQRSASYDYQSGEDYVHLGYLSGGVPAIQLFAANPRAAVLSGFAASVDSEGGSMAGWNSPVLEGVQSLSDFSAVIVITAGAESARSWTEQVHPWLNGKPLVMVLSAGVEPMIRPYYEALDPQVNGLLSGEPAAVAYELRIGKAGQAVERWNPFSLGILVLEILLICGGFYGIGTWILQAVRPRPKAKRA
ncbi:MAG: hypothetical protein NTU91_00150, partial [Chloroflexi bacterium]|nr:hypothetical protein [Chloroflexota bacterium]